MVRDTDCAASLTFSATGEPYGRSTCPVCGAPIELGYGGRIPVHPTRADSPNPETEGAAATTDEKAR